MAEKATLESIFDADNAERADHLATARHCARLTKPWILPQEGTDPNSPTPQNFQSLGARGITNLEGKMLAALFPPMLPWLRQCLKPKIEYSPAMTPQMREDYYQRLWVRDLLIQSALESAGVDPDGNQSPSGFRTTERRSISQCLITGDTLKYLDDDYRQHVYRLDQYVTRRNDAAEWLYSMIALMVDPLAKLTKAQFAKSGLKRSDLEKKKPHERRMRMITRTEFHPFSRKWVIEQEVNKNIVNTSEETVNPYFSVPYDLSGGGNYGHGFVELNRGDLTSYDAITEKALDYVAAASKMTPVIDEHSEVKENDLKKRSGEPMRASVSNGVVRDIGFLKVDKFADISGVLQIRQEIGGSLGKAMLLASESVRDSERTTKFEVQAVTIREVEAATNGAYANIEDAEQRPLAQRLIFQLQRDKVMAPLPKGTVDIKLLTGLAAIANLQRAQSLLNVAQVAQLLGPEGLAKINQSVFLDVYARYSNVFEPAVIKSNEQVAKEQQNALAQQAALAAAQEGAKAAGQIAVNAAQPQA